MNHAYDQPVLFLVEPMMAEIEAALDARYDVHRLFDPAEAERIASALPSVRAVVTGGGTGLSRSWFDRLPALGIVAINGVGTDKVDLAHARERSVHVSTTPGVLAGDVADIALLLILGTLRRAEAGERLVRTGAWGSEGPAPLGTRLADRRIGILGLGQIGRQIACRASAFGMEIGYWNRSPVETPRGWWRARSPLELAKGSDILVAALAANRETDGLVSREVIDAVGPDGLLVNVARGSVVDEPALIEALRFGRLGGAGLDVFWNEPHIDPVFRDLPNVMLLPHQGSATNEARRAMGNIVLDNLAAFFAGKTPPTSLTARDAEGASA